MNVILKENVSNLGSIGEIVRVSSGYARNFLFPRRLAEIADDKKSCFSVRRTIVDKKVAVLEHKKRALKKKLSAIKAEKEEEKNKLEQLALVIRRKAGENGKLFESVTTQDVLEAIEAKGYKLDRKQLELDQAVKKLGTYKVAVRIMEGISAQINLSVVADVE